MLPPARYSRCREDNPTETWWVGLTRHEFHQRRAEEHARMDRSYFGRLLTAGTYPVDFSASRRRPTEFAPVPPRHDL